MPESADRQKLAELTRDIRVAMMTTVDDGGQIHSRPMATIESEFDGQLWFVTDVRSHKVHELQREHHVNLDYVDQVRERFVSVSGVAKIVRDPDRIRQLWKPVMKAYFPDGVDDANLALVKVEVKRAHYWDRPSGRLVQLVGLVKALATGERIEAEAEHEIRFH
jgi:general stress protein 26